MRSAYAWRHESYRLESRPKRKIAKDIKSCTNCSYVINSMSRGNDLAPNMRLRNSLPCTVACPDPEKNYKILSPKQNVVN